jgi:hypothetical protein
MNRQARRPAKIAGTRLRGGFHERCDGAGNLRRLAATAMRGIVQPAVDRLGAVVEDHDLASATEAGAPPGACLDVGTGCDRQRRFLSAGAWAHGHTDAETEWCATPGWDDVEPWGSA